MNDAKIIFRNTLILTGAMAFAVLIGTLLAA